MLITKNQLRNIIKEELRKTMTAQETKEKLIKTIIIREVRQYHRIHGRIDEGFKDELAKKIAAVPGISARYAKNLVLSGSVTSNNTPDVESASLLILITFNFISFFNTSN